MSHVLTNSYTIFSWRSYSFVLLVLILISVSDCSKWCVAEYRDFLFGFVSHSMSWSEFSMIFFWLFLSHWCQSIRRVNWNDDSDTEYLFWTFLNLNSVSSFSFLSYLGSWFGFRGFFGSSFNFWWIYCKCIDAQNKLWKSCSTSSIHSNRITYFSWDQSKERRQWLITFESIFFLLYVIVLRLIQDKLRFSLFLFLELY